MMEDASPCSVHPDYCPESDPEADPEEDDDEDPEEDPVDYPADGGDDGDDKDEPSEEDEDYDVDIEANEDEEEEAPCYCQNLGCASTSRYITHHPNHALPIGFTTSTIPSPTTTPDYHLPSLPLSPHITCRDEAASTSHSLPLPPPFILSPTRSDAPSSGIPPPLPISVPTSSPPLLLPSASRREDRPEVTLPPRKRLGIALGPRYEIRHDLERDVRYRITDSWDEIVETLQGAPISNETMLGQRSTMHILVHYLMETEARLSQEAWRRSMDASDLAREEVMSLCTTILGQMSEIRELHAADRRRQAVTLEMVKAKTLGNLQEMVKSFQQDS
ncbi:hypothetical protein Tco_0206672 [Tanacetum coccineum]